MGTVLFLCILCKEYQKILFNFCNVLTLLSGMLLGSNFQFLFAEVNFFLFVLTLISVQSKSLFRLMAKCRSLGCIQYILTHNVTFIKQLFKNENVFVRSCIFSSESQYCYLSCNLPSNHQEIQEKLSSVILIYNDQCCDVHFILLFTAI